MHWWASSEVGQRELLLGNEAVVRGAIEAGVGLVAGYPGTPASEIGDSFHLLHRELGIDFEYSVNEKIALELAFGASLTGTRSLVSMKHLGLSYGADPLSTMPYIGTVGGMVIVSAADPGCLTSPNEQDQRYLAQMFGLPTLDPATPEEARQMTVFAYQLSEACELPVLLRMTTRVCHTRAPVELGPISARRPAAFRRDPSRFLPTPDNARRLRKRLEARLEIARSLLASSPFHPRTGGAAGASRRGVIAAGCPRNAVRESLVAAGFEAPLLELGGVHPLPEELVASFLRELEQVLVVEELSPFLEDQVAALAQRRGLRVRIHGKRDRTISWPFELEAEEIDGALRMLLGLAPLSRKEKPSGPTAPPRPPVLCPGCPHRNTFHAAAAVFGEKTVYANDIGCYTLGAHPPYRAGDVLLAMGSALPIAAAISRTTGERTVAFLGDSTFFHSGMPGLLDAVGRNDNLVVVMMDNRVTAMTGLQPSPAGNIAQVARAIGVKDVSEVPVADLAALIRELERARGERHLSLIVAQGPCALLEPRSLATARARPEVDPARCHTCGMSQAGLHCGLAPSLPVQKRAAVQRAAHPDRAAATPATSPCSLECPLGICIPAYVGAIAAGDPARALEAVSLRAALPSVCSHICHRPCEESCVRGPVDGSVQVNALKRYLTEHHLEPRAPRPPLDGLRVAIVGAGPAGLSAARELARRGYAPTLFDSRARAGGMLEHAVPEYRMPRAVLRRDVQAVLAEGMHFQAEQALGRDFSLADLRARGFSAILLAVGAMKASRPSISGAERATDALAFLAEPPRLDGQQVLVAGGGDVAIDVARASLRRGAASVTLVFPEPEDELAAAPDAVAAAREEGARFLPGHLVSAIGDRVELSRVVGFRREPGRGVRWETLLPAEGVADHRVVFATGQELAAEELGLPPGLVGESGWLDGDEFGRTRVAGLFVAGDACTGPSTVTQAMASGVRAAFAIDAFLAQGKPVRAPSAPLPRPRPRRQNRCRSITSPSPSPSPSTSTSTSTSASASESAALRAQTEASRCFLCGMCQNCNACVELLGCPGILRGEPHPRILGELCVGCGACVQACPNGAIGVRE